MSQSWYNSQPGPVAPQSNSSKAPPNNMHHGGYNHGSAPAPGSAMNHYHHRSSPPAMASRPPSSASTCSTSSYHTAGTVPGPVAAAPPNNYHHHHGHGPGVSAGQRPNHGHGPPSHIHAGGPGGGMRPMGGAARYPMPPRNGSMQHRQSSGGGVGGFHHGGPLNNRHLPLAQHTQKDGGQALLPITQGHHQHLNHPKLPTSSLMRSGHVPVHQPVPFRRGPPHHHMAAAAGGGAHYHNTSHLHHQQQRHTFNPHHRHQGPPHGVPPPPPGAGLSQHYPPHRPLMDHQQSISRSPSPPPAPPTAAETSANNARPSPTVPHLMDRRISDGAVSALGPLRERQNVQAHKPLPSAQEPSSQKAPQTADMTADAASILLELRAVLTQKSAKTEQENGNAGDQENSSQDLNQMHTNTSPFLDNPANDGASKASIVESGSSDEDASTIAPPDLANESSPPDLTSEPSSDHTEADLPQVVPENFPTRLALPHDDSKLNSLHCFLRSELLEVFVVKKSNNKSPTHSPGSSVGRVGLRCVHCALVRQRHRDDRDEAPMAVFYPKSIAEIYRLVTSWQRCHLRKCRNLPPPVRSVWQSLRDNDKSRGKTHYWVTSAKEIGLVDCQSRAGGIRFGAEAIKRFLEEAASNDNSKDKVIEEAPEDDAAMTDATEHEKQPLPPTEVTTVTVPPACEQEVPVAKALEEDDTEEAASSLKDEGFPTSHVTTEVEPPKEPTAATPEESVEAMLDLKHQLPPRSEVEPQGAMITSSAVQAV